MRGQGCDAIGALFAIMLGIRLQLEELAVWGGSAAKSAIVDDLATLRKALADTYATLESTSLAYAPYAQRVAATVSMGVYIMICAMITAVGVGD